MSHLIAPSILSADFANLGKDIEMLNNSNADWIHVDVMDGRFVPNISFGFPVMEAIKPIAKKPMDVHLMILEPEKYVETFHAMGAEVISVHIEACSHLHRNLQQIKNLGIKSGVAINPHTPVSQLEDVLGDIDVVCMMSVNPGFGGQKFIENTYRKVEALKEMIINSGAPTLIEIDGGVNLDTGKKLIEAGADVLVAGSFVFNSDDPSATIDSLKAL